MNRKKRKNRNKRPATAQRAARPSSCRAVAIVDSARIKRKAMTDCRRARATFDKAEAELDVFENKDKPAFVRWYHMALGPLIGEAKTQARQLNELQHRMERLRRFAEMKRCGIREATRIYERSIEEFEAIERKLEERAVLEEELRRQQAERRHDMAMKELKRDLHLFLRHQAKKIKMYLREGASKTDLFYDLVGFFSDEEDIDLAFCVAALQDDEGTQVLKEVGLEGVLDQDYDPSEIDDDLPPDLKALFAGIFDIPLDDAEVGASLGINSPSPPTDDARLTALYRELAFALHPDQSDSDADPAKLELWYQVQAAFEARDLDRMEVLYAHLQVLTGELSPSTPVSRLMDLTQMYRSSRDALRRRIRELRKTMEWGFSTADDARREELKCHCAAHLEEEMALLRQRIEYAEALYEKEFKPRVNKSGRTAKSAASIPGNGQAFFEGFL